MTCPCCERNARLETSDEYDARTGDSLSGDVAISSRDIMIERCREAVDGNRTAENRDGSRHLRVVPDGRMGSERLASVRYDWAIRHYAERVTSALGLARRYKSGVYAEIEIERAARYMHELRERLGLEKVSFLVDEDPAEPAEEFQ